MKRENGYYWVKYFNTWKVAYYHSDKRWRVIGSEDAFLDITFSEIDENRITKQ